ncbi:FAD-binding protein [Trujillonella endophytica]|uniref:FAD/FMN-containing dehydrogenase n=1 Tax=Trujillonella endophytica TaxID=673521 RepID=A0A1H8Q0A2_9ACTN|nr:FAD-binding protein [Trujillella endophytica]SEO47669.1 FAD/FMN-containing dehydrogenase [Trujillella endophytica]
MSPVPPAVPTAVPPADRPALPPDLAARLRSRLSPGAALVDGSVVRAATAADVVAVLRLAGRHGIAVREGTAPLPRAVVVDTTALAGTTVSPAGWARIGAGAVWTQVLDAAAGAGLVAVTGASAAERVVDSVTGGGVGPVARTYGLASDHVRAVEVVTGDGVLRRATPTEDAELFWGIRGGGSGLGVVTAVELDLLPGAPLGTALLRYPGGEAAAVLRAWREWAPALPPHVGTTLVLARPRAGEPTVAVSVVWTGEPEDGAGVIAPLRDAVRPRASAVGVRGRGDLRPAAVGRPSGRESSLLLDRLPAAGADAALRALGGGLPRWVEVRLLGGAVGWAPAVPSAVGPRDAALAVRVIGGGRPEERAATRVCADELAGALGQATGGRAPAHDRAASPDVLARDHAPAVRARLAALSAATDPHRILEGAGG